MELRPDKERALRESFERKLEEERVRHADRLEHAAGLARRFELGDVVAVFSADLRGETPFRAYAWGLSSLALIPLGIAGAQAGIPGAIGLLGAAPVVVPLTFGLAVFLGRPRQRIVWLYACTHGFTVVEDEQDAVPVLWRDVAEVHEVWVDVHNDEGPNTRELTGWQLRFANGTTRDVPRSFANVLDRYRDVGPLLAAMLPEAVGRTIPRLPRIDDIITTYARRESDPQPG